MRRVTSFAASILLLTGCSEPPTSLSVDAPLFSIEDAVHNGGNEHFFWLPPMVSSPSYAGTFDGTLSPVVEVCEWLGADCVLPLLAEFTTTTGPGSETVRVVPADEHYIVNWHTDEFNLDPAKTYRIVARVDDQELGHADVDVVSNGSQLRNVDTDEYIALKDGRTLPIKFRIEEGAIITDPCAVITFADAALEALVREKINKPTGDITSADVAGVHGLSGPNRGITDLSGIECLDLYELNIHTNQIADLGPVSALTNLTYLNVSANTVLTDLGPLASNTALEDFRCVSCSNVADLSPLVGATNMQRIDLSRAFMIQSLAPLSAMTQLYYLKAHSSLITDLTPLAGATGLTTVDLRDTQVSDLSPLAGATGMQEFLIARSNITDISPMAGWTQLIELQMLQEHGVTDLSPLAGLVTLERLNIISTGVQDISPLSGLTNLKVLQAGDAPILDLSPVAGLTSLEHLDVRGTYDITPVAGLLNLKELEIRQAAPDLSPLSGLVNLEILSATDMNTTDLSPIVGLANLWRLEISRNHLLSDLTPLTSMAALTRLNVSQSNVSDTSPLAGIALLNYVDVRTNPISCPDATLSALAAGGVTVLTDCF